MNKFGLYAVDATRSNYYKGFRDPELNPLLNLNTNSKKIYTTDWPRTKLMYGGNHCNTTVKEKNKFGFYVVGKRFVCNGDDIATCTQHSTFGDIKQEGDIISYGGAVLGSSQTCINVTLENYNKLRNFIEVPGYSRYNPFAVYNITNDLSTIKTCHIPEGVEDMTYQSLVYKASEDCQYLKQGTYDIDSNDALSHNTISDKTFTSGLIPELKVRYVTPVIHVGEYIEFEYFTDTKYYDSIHNCRLDQANTFTLIVTTSEGTVVYKNTTYAGQYKIAIRPYSSANDIGEHWLHFQIIDNEGRGSIDYYYEVYVNKAIPFIKVMTSSDCVRYGITPIYDTSLRNLESARNNIVAGYENKIGFEQYFKELADGTYNGTHYDGVKLLCAKYFIDTHNIIEKHGSRIIPKFSKYYLLYYKNGALGKLNADGTFTPVITNGDNCLQDVYPYAEYLDDNNNSDTSVKIVALKSEIEQALAPFELTPNSTINVPLITTDTQNNTTSINVATINIPANNTNLSDADFIFDKIYDDIANIYRENNNIGGRILRKWNHDLSENEVCPLANKDDNTTRALRIRSLNAALDKCKSSKLTEPFYDTENGEGWFYLAYFDGPWVRNEDGIYTTQNGNDGYYIQQNYMGIPDNFILDGNGSEFISTNIEDVANNTKCIALYGNVNTHIKDLKIQGDYTHEHVTRAYLKQNRKGGGVTWEGNGSVGLSGAKFCTFDNVELCNDGGYEFTAGPLLNQLGNYSYTINKITTISGSNANLNYPIVFDYIGYIANNVVKPYTNHVYYTADDVDDITTEEQTWNTNNPNTKICLLSTSDYIDISGISYAVTAKGKAIHYTPGNNGFSLVPVDSIYKHAHLPSSMHHVFFIHLYTANNTYKGTIKTRMCLDVRIPDDVTKIKLTAYGICEEVNNNLSIVYEQYGNEETNARKLAKALSNIELTTETYTKSVLIKNCKVHDTKSTAITGPGINLRYENCEFSNISYTPEHFKKTAHLMDVEENVLKNDAFSLINCVNYTNEALAIGTHKVSPRTSMAMASWGFYMRGCKGISFYNSILNGSCVIDSIVPNFTITHDKWRGDNYQNIFKRVTILGRRESWASGGSGDSTGGAGTYCNIKRYDGSATEIATRKTHNPSEEQVFDTVTFTDCFVNIVKGTMPNKQCYNVLKDPVYTTDGVITLETNYQRDENFINI